MGILVLVGAGPGDPDLITLKGLNAIKKADVILYDALIDKRLLEYAAEKCEKIFVGKRGYQKSLSQERINEMCVEYCKSNNYVVRLKGGDPFVFGRGHEEVEYAALFGIESKVIPGLSSITSLSTLQGVPLTRRNITSGFTVVTAVNKDVDLTDELINGIKSDLTLVVLMGLKKLGRICDLYKVRNKMELPVMIIQNGSLPNEKCVTGTIETIEQKVIDKNVSSPAIMIIGKVVGVKQTEREVLNGQ